MVRFLPSLMADDHIFSSFHLTFRFAIYTPLTDLFIWRLRLKLRDLLSNIIHKEKE